MAMMTAANAPSGKRHGRAQRLSAQAPAAEKASRSYNPGGGLTALAARISMTIDLTAGDNASCLARQAGPGPRI